MLRAGTRGESPDTAVPDLYESGHKVVADIHAAEFLDLVHSTFRSAEEQKEVPTDAILVRHSFFG
jgi:hypothetical protein